MKILGIESSCDETAAAIVEDGHHLLSNVVASSMALHIPYGGVVPEIAARSHIESIGPVIQQALEVANVKPHQLDGIAVTYGAGLGGSLLIGVMTARTLALAWKKPLYAANHVLGHVYANFLTSSSLSGYLFASQAPRFPLLAVIVSGGHSQLALFHDHFDYQLLGQTQDDAIGEAFDKVAKMLGLPYPGGPSIAAVAQQGDAFRYQLPKAKVGRYDFSFSGLKTAVLRLAQQEIGETYAFPSTKLSERLSEAQKASLAASFQRVAVETIADKVILAASEFRPTSIVLAGGVAANQALRSELTARLPSSADFNSPDLKLCTDNGAMIATLGCYQATYGAGKADPMNLSIAPNLSM